MHEFLLLCGELEYSILWEIVLAAIPRSPGPGLIRVRALLCAGSRATVSVAPVTSSVILLSLASRTPQKRARARSYRVRAIFLRGR